jgi:uncharacterized protein (TIGR02996 family)
MSADEAALLAAVAADPASDLPRLLYADFLDDRGQAVRAEFIRVQCTIAKLEVGPRSEVDRNWRLWKRQQELLDDHARELLPSGADALLADRRPVFARGFLAELTFREFEFAAAADFLVGVVPRPAVRVHGVGLDAGEFAQHPGAVRAVVTAVAMQDDAPDDDPFVPTEGEWDDFLAVPWPRLHRLDLMACEGGAVLPGVMSDHARTLPELAELDLSGNDLTDAEVTALLNLGLPQRLTRLTLDFNPLGNPSAFELADRLRKSPTLRELNIRQTNVTAAGQAALTAAFGSRCNLF